MSIFTKRGAAAVASATAEKETSGNALVPFGSGTSYKVRVKSPEDSVEYYAYGVYGKVNTFVPKIPAERNSKGFIVANPTVWDQASELLYKDAASAKKAGDEAKAEKLRQLAYQLKGKPRYLVGFGSLETGEDIVVDLTPKQASAVFATISKYANKLDKLAFELSKNGTGTGTVVSLTPIIDMDEDLTEQERKNFKKCGEKPFDFELFETCLYVADEEEQVKRLAATGFDISRLGLSISEAVPVSDDSAEVDPTLDF